MQQKAPFKDLFRKYRLRSEFETLNDFGNALADLNYIFENSIFSHWQKGTRVPHDRRLVIAIIKLFLERKAILSLQDANLFLSSTGQGYLTDEEIFKLPFPKEYKIPFQVPRLPDHFIGRKQMVEDCKNKIKKNEIVVLQGPPGIGKTFIAIKIAHEMAELFPDGIIWCNGKTNDPRKIMHEIVEAFGEALPIDSTLIQTTNLYRSIVRRKKALFIIDDLSPGITVEDILPNSSQSGVIITTIFISPTFLQIENPITVPSMSLNETEEIYKKFIPANLFKTLSDDLKILANEIENLPLLLVILSKQIAHSPSALNEFLTSIRSRTSILETFPYKEKTLHSSLSVAYDKLDVTQQKILKIASLFKGNTFTIQAISHVLPLPISKTIQELNNLCDYSFIEKNDETRYRLHNLISIFLRSKKINKKYVKNIADYYVKVLTEQRNKSNFFFVIAKEVENIVGIIKTCIECNLIDECCILWQLFGDYYWHVGHWESFQGLSTTMYNIAKKHSKKELQLSICLKDVSRLYYYDGDINSAIVKAQEALIIAKNIDNPFLIALSLQRFGKLCFINNNIKKGFESLEEAYTIFLSLDNYEYLSHNLRYMSEGYVLKEEYTKANKLLDQSLENLLESNNENAINIYSAVISSHKGILNLLDNKFDLAKKNFENGIKDDGNVPLIRGTYTWLSKLGLAVTLMKMNFNEEGIELLNNAKAQMKQLGIDKSFTVINVYADKLSSFL